MEKDLAMYLLLNKDIEISKGKIPSQIGHAIIRYTTSPKGKEDNALKEFLDLDDDKRIIITLACSQKKLEQLENQGYPTQRDLGLTELPPNTITCICYGVVDRNNKDCESAEGMPKWLKRLRIYEKE